jgi:glutamine amidotransferase-like uncharacterized protein
MISCDHGTIKLSGTAIELTADVITIQEALLRTIDNKTSDHRKLNERLIKNIIYSFTRSASEKGYRTTFTDGELRNLEEAWGKVHE